MSENSKNPEEFTTEAGSPDASPVNTEDWEDLTTGVNYEKSKEKYQDNMSTAITFLVFGAAGIVLVILNIVGVLPFFSLKNASGILITVVLGLMFVIFMVIGIASFAAAGKNKKDVKTEDDNTSKVFEWLEANVSAEEIDVSFDSSELSDEMKFFGRSDYLKNVIDEHFPELPADFVDNIIEQYIEKIF